MLRSLFFKEWLKTRMAVILVAVASMGLCAYILITTGRMIEANSMMPVWDTLLNRDMVLIELLRYVPLIAGILLGVTQILPEMTQKRIKLTLHLPVDNWKSIGTMVLYGAVVMLGLALLNLGTCFIVLRCWLPAEILRHIFLTALVWYVAGILAYFFTVWITLEPTWKMRIPELLFAAACLRGFYMSSMPEVYNAFLPIMVVFTLLCSTLPMLSIDRFKQGLGL